MGLDGGAGVKVLDIELPIKQAVHIKIYHSLTAVTKFDQSTMGIFLSRLYQEDLWKIQFKELAFNKGKEFRVLRGDSKRSYFIG
ncbi:hypothetical protein PoB_004820200 [Plakobranchus ocellatus]|uniref:Uncharacterized protein n=1 Tax=Plakobranchus ocellatus TaxID=259542 RepID=A0AAV4BQQ2_9GAST|nr:hypothetical protein PoB_004820200 [Plakobranchus ocellatus]